MLGIIMALPFLLTRESTSACLRKPLGMCACKCLTCVLAHCYLAMCLPRGWVHVLKCMLQAR